MGEYSRIAKNTVFLYFRMIVAMFVGLYTSRIFLQALGAEDYGIYNVVGGFVAMFALISGALTGAISRFLTFELGRGQLYVLRIVFTTSIIVLIGISIIVIVVGETIGLWFVQNKLVIPPTRMYAAFWVYQLALLSFIIKLLVIPYNACVVSHERMGAFAYISIIEVFSKLIICYAVMYSPIDRLIFYSILLCIVSVSISLIYIVYCRRNFEECRGKLTLDKSLLRDMFGFAGWSFIGSSGWILRSQGGTILLNIFGGPIVNTANAIAFALSSAASNFVNCFTTSFNPQITKQYAAGSFVTLNQLILYSSKFSFFMLYIVALPIFLNAQFILYIWLGEVPNHTVEFVRLILLVSLVDIISVPLITLKNATGNIRNYQIFVGLIQLLSLPLGYVGLKLGAPVEWLYIAYIVVSILCLFSRMYMLNGDISLWSSAKFLSKVCLRVWIVAILAAIVPAVIFFSIDDKWANLVVTTTFSVLSSLIIIYFVGLTKDERVFVNSKSKTLWIRLKQQLK